jgi:heterodisulfide reductase subunit A-like polyferredoxin
MNNKKTLSCNRRTWLGTMAAMFAGHSLSVQGRTESTGKELKISQTGRVFETDVLVCGGGPAGFAAATMSARQGVKTILAERYGRLGGMAVHARVIPLNRYTFFFLQQLLCLLKEVFMYFSFVF